MTICGGLSRCLQDTEAYCATVDILNEMLLFIYFCHSVILLKKKKYWTASLLDCKEIQPVNPKGNQSWIFIERTDAEAETPILWTPDVKNWLIGKVLGKIEGRRRRGQQRMRWLDGITDLMDIRLSKLMSWWWTGKPGVLRCMGSERVGQDWVTELNWLNFI